MNVSYVYANEMVLCSFIHAPVPTGDQNILSARYFEWIILLKEWMLKYLNQGRDGRQNHGSSNSVHVLIPRPCDCAVTWQWDLGLQTDSRLLISSPQKRQVVWGYLVGPPVIKKSSAKVEEADRRVSVRVTKTWPVRLRRYRGSL